ncbi:MAG: adenylate/guanylate cyclase domain-containing protein [Chlamydiota bacterium]
MLIKKFLFKKRRIQVHLITIFLVLLTASSWLITRYTYYEYYKDIESLALQMISQTSNLLSEKVMSVKNEAKLIVEVIKGSIHTDEEATGRVSSYTNFLVNILRQDPLLTEITLATPAGDYFAIMNVNLESVSHFYSHPIDKLPKECRYMVRTVRKNGSIFEEIWNYLSEDGTVLATEVVAPASYDFQQNPWLLGMLKNPELRWGKELLPRGVDKYDTEKAPSIVVSDAVKDSQGNTLAVFSVGLTLKQLSGFISDQKVGKTGSVFVIDNEGNIEVPLSYGSTPDEIFKKSLLEEGYAEFKQKNKRDLNLLKDGKHYLFSIHDSFNFSDNNLSIAIIVPFDDLFGNIAKTQNQTRLASLFIAFICGIAVYFSSKYFSKPIVTLAKEVDKIRDFDFTTGAPLKSLIKEVSDLESSISALRLAVHSFGRYVPKEVVRALIKYGHDVHLGGERIELTIMFSDVENFTTISESMPMEKLMTILSDYFDVLSKIVLKSEGTIDKYIGDSLMAFWGAPIKIADHAEKACLTCLQCLAAVKLEKKWVTRFGLHTGEVIVGNIGTSERINYTVIGDAVNVASRLEGINKEYHTSIMISEVVHEKIGPSFVTRPVDFVAVKGKRNKLKIFELMGMTDGALAATSEQIELSKLFTEAYMLFEEEKLEEAFLSFLEIEKKFPLDYPTKKYLERLKKT